MKKHGADRIPKLTRHATGRARLRIGGREMYLGLYGSAESRQRYQRVVQEWLSAGCPDPWIGPAAQAGAGGGMKVAELLIRYVDFAKQHYRKNGEETSEVNAITSACSFVRTLYGFEPIERFGPLALKNCQDLMARSDLCRNVVNQYVGRIKRMFKWAVANELIVPSLYHALVTVPGLRHGRSGARETKRVLPVARDHLRKTLRHVSRQVRTMIRVQLLTGMRPGEVVAMRPLDINTSEDLWVYSPESHKTEHHDKQRVVDLGARCQRVIRPFLKPDTHAYLFSTAEAEAERAAEARKSRKTKLFPSHLKRLEEQRKIAPREFRAHYGVDSYRRAIARGCDLAGVPVWHPHQLRHNFATRIRKTHGIETARVLLSHSSPLTTEIYAEVDRAKARKVMEACG